MPSEQAHVPSVEGAEEVWTLGRVAKEIIEAARSEGLNIRVIGGVAVRIHSTSAEHRSLERSYGDIDLVGRLAESKSYTPLMESLGFEPNRPFNTLNGSAYLRFDHAVQAIHIDVFLDRLEMCHRLELLDRLEMHPFTLSLADLLLSKLQIVQLTEKDAKDVIALLMDHPIVAGGDDSESIDAQRIGTVCGEDWGWFRTVTGNLERCRAWFEQLMPMEYEEVGRERIEAIRQAIENAPKSLKWKLRAKVGDKVKWYELPEDPTRD